MTITRASATQRVPGVLAAAALPGTPLQLTGGGGAASAFTDTLAVAKADRAEGRIYFNYREVIAGTEQPLANVIFGNSDVNPVLVNTPVDLITAEEIEVEGGNVAADGKADYLLLSGTDSNRGFVGDEAAGTRLTVVAGRWARVHAVATEAIYGRLLKWLTPADATNLRALIEVYSEARFDKIV